jgi:hypothetical protein
VRRRTLLYNSTQAAATTAAAGEPMRKHAKSPAKAIPGIVFIAPRPKYNSIPNAPNAPCE